MTMTMTRWSFVEGMVGACPAYFPCDARVCGLPSMMELYGEVDDDDDTCDSSAVVFLLLHPCVPCRWRGRPMGWIVSVLAQFSAN